MKSWRCSLGWHDWTLYWPMGPAYERRCNRCRLVKSRVFWENTREETYEWIEYREYSCQKIPRAIVVKTEKVFDLLDLRTIYSDPSERSKPSGK